jgi:DNA-directed RNA polymerase sigma subunit (sigma70/sigma32)
MLSLAQDTLSIEGIGSEETDILQVVPDPDAVDPESTVLEREQTRILRRALEELPPRERIAISRRVGLDIPDEETAGVRQQRNDAARAIQKLRAIAERHRLREFFDR